MSILCPLLAIIALIFLVIFAVGPLGLHVLFAIVVPYTGLALFLTAFVYRIILWARSPVPFHIPTVCGQQQSLSWIKGNNLESPQTTSGVIWRMLLEVCCFRSLFRNDRVELFDAQSALYRGSRYLWLGGLLFHWSLLVILVHHLRFFVEPVPLFVTSLQSIDGLFQLALPTFLITDGLVVIALTYLFVRRVVNPHVRYISLSSDYFPLLLIGGIAISGILMRHVIRVDLLEVKHYAMSMLTFDPTIPREVGLIFHVHLFLVCLLLAYFPFSKLMHMPGVFMSPTRNLKNDSRAKRHINPWNHPVKVHTYAEWEDEFRDALKEAGIPVEKE